MAPIKAQDETGAMPNQVNHENREGTARLAGSPGAFVFSSAIGPRIMLAPPDAPGSSPTPEPSPAPEPAPSPEPAPAPEPVPQKAERPEFIPENFWDADKGFKSEDFNALIARDAERASRLAQVPDSPDKYEAKLPHDFKMPEGVELAEGENLINPDDPRIADLREFAHANQMDQSQFENMVALGAKMDLAESGRLKEAIGQEVEKLGAKGKERIGAVKSWIASKLPGEQGEALLGVIYTAKQVEAFERLMQLNRGGVPGNPGAGREPGKTEISDEEYDKMSPAERINYARQNSKR